MRDTLVLRQDWSEGMFAVSIGVFGAAIFFLSIWSSNELNFDLVDLSLFSIWAVFAISIMGVQVRRIATKMIWAQLFPDGVSNSDGKKLLWSEVSEIRFMLGEIWIGQTGRTLPFLSLSARVIGQSKLNEAERYLRQYAPSEITGKM